MPPDHEEILPECGVRFDHIEGDIKGLEKEVCMITKPEEGSLAKMNNRMNKGFANRPKWKIFLALMGAIFTLVLGSYAYTKTVSDQVDQLVTKEDMRAFKNDILNVLKGIDP